MKHRFPRVTDRVVLNPRGTNGSGKSTIVFQLMKKFGCTALTDDSLPFKSKVWAYKLHCYPPMYVVGRYETATGGCDTVKTLDEVGERICKLSKKGDVLFEGLLASGLYGRFLALEHKLPRCRFVYCTLDTPLKVCIERVIQRRAAKGKIDELNPKALTNKFWAVKSSRLGLMKAGSRVADVPYENPMKAILEIRSKAHTRFPR